MLKSSFILKSHIFKREWPDVQLSHHVIYTSLSNMLKGRCLFILPPCFLSSGNPHCKCSTSQRWKRLARVCATSASSLSNSREDCHTSAARENFGSCCLPLPKKGGGRTSGWPLSFRTILYVNMFPGMRTVIRVVYLYCIVLAEWQHVYIPQAGVLTLGSHWYIEVATSTVFINCLPGPCK